MARRTVCHFSGLCRLWPKRTLLRAMQDGDGVFSGLNRCGSFVSSDRSRQTQIAILFLTSLVVPARNGPSTVPRRCPQVVELGWRRNTNLLRRSVASSRTRCQLSDVCIRAIACGASRTHGRHVIAARFAR